MLFNTEATSYRNAIWESGTTLRLTVRVHSGCFEGASNISTWPDTIFHLCDELKAISQKNIGSTELVEGDLDEIYENEIRFFALKNGYILVRGKIVHEEKSSMLSRENVNSLEFEFEVACGMFDSFVPALERETQELVSQGF